MVTGVSRYTVEGDERELVTFRESMLALASQIHEQAGGTELEATVQHALDLVRDYNDRALKFNHAHTNELKTVMRTMTETITYLRRIADAVGASTAVHGARTGAGIAD